MIFSVDKYKIQHMENCPYSAYGDGLHTQAYFLGTRSQGQSRRCYKGHLTALTSASIQTASQMPAKEQRAKQSHIVLPLLKFILLSQKEHSRMKNMQKRTKRTAKGKQRNKQQQKQHQNTGFYRRISLID